MNNENNKTRRDFLGNILRTGSLAAAGGLIGIGLSRDACGLGMQNQPDRTTVSPIDPKLILYREISETIFTGMTEARALTVDSSGILYIAGDQTIKVIEPGGAVNETHALTVTPRCLAPAEKELYIGTRDRIVVADKNGSVQSTWPSPGEHSLITGIAVDEEHVYIADAGERVVWCYDQKGKFIRRIGDKDLERDIPGFVVPSPYFDLAMGYDGLLWIANPGRHQIEAYTVKGDREFAWGKFGNRLEDFTACCNPMNFAILPDGGFVTCEKGIVRIKAYDAAGKLRGLVAGPEQLMEGELSSSKIPKQSKRSRFDVAANISGHVYVLDRDRSVVRIFGIKI